MDGPAILIFIFFIALVVAAGIAASIAAKKRREAFASLARRLGLSFSADHDREIARQYQFLDKLAQGSNRYAYNVVSGNFHGHSIAAFDYHFQTESRDSKGNRQTHHHHFSFFILHLERSFPELTIAREGFFSKIAQAFGYDDIDFESHEFSRRFCVRSKDKKFAYDVCNARMIEFLLANDDFSIEIEGPALAMAFSGCLKPEAIEGNLRRLMQLRSLMPDYLFAAA
ncbi:MAG: DUF3137 domain-containing protein [Verrucomicrobia subdivision 3 bacterium]|nr:DUF3137 domain-containing protein [Limisphaerales bacterium]